MMDPAEKNARHPRLAGIAAGALLGLWEAREAALHAPFHFDHALERVGTPLVAAALYSVVFGVVSVVAAIVVAGLAAPKSGESTRNDAKPAVTTLISDSPAGATLLSVLFFSALILPALSRLIGARYALRSPVGVAGVLLLTVIVALLSVGAGRAVHRFIAGRRRWGSALFAFAAAALLVLYARALPAPHTLSPAPAGVKSSRSAANLLLITIDTLRPDYLGCYGNPAVLTPNIDRLAKEGSLRPAARTAVPITLPSHTSLLSGVPPRDHGVRDNGECVPIDDLPLLQETFLAKGYRTAAVVAAFPLDSYFGLDRGFERYDDDFETITPRVLIERLLDGGSPGRLATRLKLRRPTHHVAERSADSVTRRAIDFLAAMKSDPFFLWVHYYDPHAPYDAPDPYPLLYNAGEFGKTPVPCDGVEIPRYARRYGTDDMRDYRAAYAAEVTRTDRAVGDLLDALRRFGLDRNTRVVLTADHGEGLGDHDVLTHTSRLYEEQIRVPLVVREPRGTGQHTINPLPGGDVPRFLASLVPDASQPKDVSPSPASQPGESIFRGVHFAETPLAGGLTAVRQGFMKLIQGQGGRPDEWYDLSIDPGERNNLAAFETGSAADSLLAALIEGYEKGRNVKARRGDIPTAARDRLRALGYMGGN